MKKLIFVSLVFALASVMVLAQDTTTQEQKVKPASNSRSITGCLQKGDEPGEFSITGEDGQTWDLRSSAVKLDEHLGHKVTVTGPIVHEPKAEQANEGVQKASSKQEYGELRVTGLMVVSETCSK